MPSAAAASAALAGTAVGSAFGCQAQVSTKRLPSVSPSFSRSVIASASAWQGCRRALSRLMTGFSQYLAKLRTIASCRATAQSLPRGKLRTPSASA